VRQSWKSCSLQAHIAQDFFLLICLLFSAAISSDKFVLKYGSKMRLDKQAFDDYHHLGDDTVWLL
jgi:hypothetical protein